MTRPRYIIQESDYFVAYKYLTRRAQVDGIRWLDVSVVDRDNGEVSQDVLDRVFYCCDAEQLNEWAARYLNSDQWRKLKQSIRNARRRAPGKSIEVSWDAWVLLRDESQKMGMTYSELIIEVLESRMYDE
ncbi:hypothetical protein [Oceanisphaera sp. IT1-181]|uniref:hypothetical protein n=1 Tax=Oceanisphaera sp. IT1-181 TaxID=3081199 RepID=UPI0029CA4D0F|nr:hypothetical protein [Oceanisphaera sp. IT1-181]